MKKENRKNYTILCLMAHPDDAEILSGGTLAALQSKGCHVVIASMTPGQAGSMVIGPEEISNIRRLEGAAAAAVIGAAYYCMESEDLYISYDKSTLNRVINLFREVQPDIVITASPQDYMLDHEISSNLAQSACMAATIPNLKVGEFPILEKVPHLYYADAVQGMDRFGKPVESDFFIDISTYMETKTEMLIQHKSQRDWLRSISKVDEFVEMMRSFSARNGAKVGVAYAEGYRQHLGFSYPHDNLLATLLKEYFIQK